MKKFTVVVSVNTTWNLVNFRMGLIRALIDAGYDVVAASPPDHFVERVREVGCRYIPVRMDNQGTKPVRDMALFLRYLMLLVRERPGLYLGYTVKPNVYGSLAAHVLGIPVVNNIAGLGAVFIKGGWLALIVRQLYSLALRRSVRVFFQNNDDLNLFVSGALVKEAAVDLLPGSGIDLSRFVLTRQPVWDGHSRKFRFLLIARMLWDKGVGEYVAAARAIRGRWPGVEFCLLGFVDVENPAAISRKQMDAWVAEGDVIYLGVKDDVRPEIVAADCIVLPSYREGTPRSLLEAAAMGRPIITTDAVGCREVVSDGVNGFLCQSRDAQDLVEKMERLLGLSHEQREEMGQRGREKMECEFDEKIVINKYLQIVNQLISA